MGTPVLHSFGRHGFHGPLFRCSGVKLAGSIIYFYHKSDLVWDSFSHPLPLRCPSLMLTCGNSAFNAKYSGVQALPVLTFPVSLNDFTEEQVANSKGHFSGFRKTLLFCGERILYTAKRLIVSAARRDGDTKLQRLKDLPRRRLRDLADNKGVSDTLSPIASHNWEERPKDGVLLSDQAIGQIVSAQANFMRVIVETAGGKVNESPLDHSRTRNLKLTGNTLSDTQVQDFQQGNDDEIAKSDSESKLSFKQTFPVETEGNKECYDQKMERNRYQKTETLSSRSGGQNPVQTSNIFIRSNSINNTKVKEIENRRKLSATEKVIMDAVQSEDQHFSDSKTDEKLGVELLCVVRALLKKINQKVLVGDRVLVSGVDWIDRRGMIEKVLDRKNEITDPSVANVDQILVLFAVDQPRLEPMSLSRFLVEAESTGIPFTLVLNKSDLVLHEELDTWKDKLLSWGYSPLFCSVNTKVGIVPLAQLLIDRMTVIIGPSGVGKSSLINALGDKAGIKSWDNLEVKHLEDDEPSETFDGHILGQMKHKGSKTFEFQMVGEVSQRSGRGKHTTRNVILLKLPIGGYLADTPGFNLPCLSKVTSKSLAKLFPEVREKLSENESGGCEFKDCLHVGEPGCTVGGKWDRYPYYLQLLEEVKKREEIELKAFGTKKESEVRYKVGAFGMKQAEPRLEPKKHRRISRQRAKQQIAEELHEEVEEGLKASLEEWAGEIHKQGEEEEN